MPFNLNNLNLPLPGKAIHGSLYLIDISIILAKADLNPNFLRKPDVVTINAESGYGLTPLLILFNWSILCCFYTYQ